MKFSDVRTVCITLHDGGYSRIHGTARTSESAAQHFAERGVAPVQFYWGLHAERLGVDTKKTYDLNFPGLGLTIGARPTGCWLSHRSLWAALLLFPEDAFLILEDDAKFPENWHERTERALADVPQDWDLLFIGSCCAMDKERSHVAGDVWAVHPFCTHAYLVRRKALDVLIRTQDAVGCYAPIDVSLALHSMPALKTFACLPRIVDQFHTELIA
jgi:Glycosyltransferase family 25 (LPS biosynthesis protein)